MFDDRNSIDIDRLRDDMRDESLGAAFGGGFLTYKKFIIERQCR